MNEKCMISIIIPIYNAEIYLRTMLNSIVNQKYKDFEVILIDDGSKDGSTEICKQFTNQNSKFKFYKKDNTGVSDSRNYGISRASGKYVCFIDSDDYIDEYYLSNMVDALLTTNVQMVCCEYKTFKHENELVKETNTKNNFTPTLYEKESKYKIIFDKFGGYLWNKLFIRDVIVNNNIKFNKNVFMSEDMLFVFDYLKYVDKVICLDVSNYYYRKLENSASKNLKNKNWFSIFKVYDHIIENRSLYTKELYNEIIFRYQYYLLFAKYRLKFNSEETELKKTIEERLKKAKKMKVQFSGKQKIKLFVYNYFNYISFKAKLKNRKD